MLPPLHISDPQTHLSNMHCLSLLAAVKNTMTKSNLWGKGFTSPWIVEHQQTLRQTLKSGTWRQELKHRQERVLLPDSFPTISSACILIKSKRTCPRVASLTVGFPHQPLIKKKNASQVPNGENSSSRWLYFVSNWQKMASKHYIPKEAISPALTSVLNYS